MKFRNPSSIYYLRSSRQEGSVLVEILIVIAVIGIIAGGLGSIFYANQRGSDVGRKSTLETSLTQEGFEAIKSIVAANDSASQGWNRIYCPPTVVNTDGGTCPGGTKDLNTPYHVQLVGSAWKLYTTSETITVSGETYTRAVYIQNVSRDTNGQIESTYVSADDDPFTQKISVIITPPSSAPSTTTVSFVTRSINKQSSPSAAPAEQTDWSGGKDASCATSTVTSYGNQYCSDDTNPDVTGTAGSIKILTQ